MKYNKRYIDEFFNNINDYHSMAELYCIAYSEFRERKSLPDWYVELSEIMNWQSQSDRAGVWTYYELLKEASAATLINRLKAKEENEILAMYILGINKYSDEIIMECIDKWLEENEEKIYQYIIDIFMENKAWFYKI